MVVLVIDIVLVVVVEEIVYVSGIDDNVFVVDDMEIL